MKQEKGGGSFNSYSKNNGKRLCSKMLSTTDRVNCKTTDRVL